MTYCARCITPSTRPQAVLDDRGVCNACAAHEIKKTIDWAQREQAFRELVQRAKARSRGYDCVIPVSGGKDSTWQTIKCLEYGLNPLAVTWKTPARTEIGSRNLANLIRLGVDHIDYQINPKVEKKFLYQALVRYGATGIPMHMALFNIPLKIALRFDIPMVVLGENSAFEYGERDNGLDGFRLDAAWLKTYGVMHGTTAKDWVGPTLTERELTPYFGPTEEELAARDVLSVFLGHYFPWDPVNSLEVARAHGFAVRAEGPKTGYYNFAGIDDDFISIHHYLKWYKFGFTRSFDHLSIEIRQGRLTRMEAIQALRAKGDETPHEDIAKFCDFINITTAHFFEVIEPFRNRQIWAKRNGTWMIPDFLIPDWEWAAESKPSFVQT